jgi:hypothetical protein
MGSIVSVITGPSPGTRPELQTSYTEDQTLPGEVRQEFSICFRGRPVGGTPRDSDESSEVRWVKQSELDSLQTHPSIRLRIRHGLENRAEPYYT